MTYADLDTGNIFTLGGTARFMKLDTPGGAVRMDDNGARGVTETMGYDITVERRWINGGRREKPAATVRCATG